MSDYTVFVKRFNISHVRVLRDRDYQTIDYGYNRTAQYYTSNREEIIEMEIPRSGFEELVRVDSKLEDWCREEDEEAYMRRKHPALKEAYDKYRMLLELYK